MISERIDQIQTNIREICRKNRRDPGEITLVAVTKYTDTEAMAQAIAAGVVNIGENRVQDAGRKFEILENQGLVFKRHMIGHLQTNKVKDAVALFDMIQSVDSWKVAAEIEKRSSQAGKMMEVLVQVNTSGEPQKSGVAPQALEELLDRMAGLEHVRVQGLMTIGPLTQDADAVARCFERTQVLFNNMGRKFSNHPVVAMQHLSMGMTHDYAQALDYGATMLRIGSGIFQS